MAVVWDCDSFKSPSLYGVKHEFMKLLWEFNTDRKMVRGSNYNCIVLILKKESAQ